MIDCVYHENMRVYRTGVVERFFANKGWKVVEHTDNHDGYNRVGINGRIVKRNRLVAFCFLGLFPLLGEMGHGQCVDHLDGDRLNDCVENLCITTAQGNQQNTRAKGYTFDKASGKWLAQIWVDGRRIHLGLFDTEAEAHEAYLTAKPLYHTAHPVLTFA